MSEPRQGRPRASAPQLVFAARWVFALPLVLLLAAGAPVLAQPLATLGPLCTEGANTDVIIGGCTAKIESGLLPPQDLAAALALRGEAFYRGKNYTQAFADFDQAVKLVPNRAAYHRGLGLARGNLRRDSGDLLANATQIEKALGDFQEAIRLNPKDPLNLIYRGDAYVALGRVERGLDDLNQAVLLNPRLAEAYMSRGAAYHVMGAYRKAIDDFDAATLLQPGSAPTFLKRGLSHDALEVYNMAIADFDTAIRLDPADPLAFNARGVSYAKQGRTDRAIEDFDHALHLNPNLADAFFNRGQAYLLKGNKDRALADYIQARQIDRRFPEPPADIFEEYEMDIPAEFRPRRPFQN